MCSRTTLALIALVISGSSIAKSQSLDSSFVQSNRAITLVFDGFTITGGVGGKWWFDRYNVIRLQVGGTHSQHSTGQYSFTITPALAFERHFKVRTNVSPYLGAHVAPEFTVRNDGSGGKRTYWRFGAIIGVESLLTDNISVAGEQSINRYYDVQNKKLLWDYDEATIFINFYF